MSSDESEWLYVTVFCTFVQWWIGSGLLTIYLYDRRSHTPGVLRGAFFFIFSALVSTFYCFSYLDEIKKNKGLFKTVKVVSGITITITAGIHLAYTLVPVP